MAEPQKQPVGMDIAQVIAQSMTGGKRAERPIISMAAMEAEAVRLAQGGAPSEPQPPVNHPPPELQFVPPAPVAAPPPPPPMPAPSPLAKFSARKLRLRYIATDGSEVRMPVVCVMDAGFGLLVFAKDDDDAQGYTPAVGAELTLAWNDGGSERRQGVYYYGVQASIEALGLQVTSFQKADTNGKA